jgi:hypothetical protein
MQPRPDGPDIQLSGEGFAEVGERVGAVLTSAHEAAEQIRRDAERYSKETREAADRYGAETRRKLDEEASQRRAEVEEEARRIRQAAEQKAKDLVTEAVSRQKALVQEAERSEARLQQLLGVFRGMTSQLEELVQPEPAAASDEKGTAEEGFEEALRPQRTPSSKA